MSHAIESNFRTITDMRSKETRKSGFKARIADAITSFSGRMIFAYVHIVWFGVWIVINLGFRGIKPFDPFPYSLLTMIVSLEAIFLSTFVLISQNRLSKESEHRHSLDTHMGQLTEHELTRVLVMLDSIQDKMVIENGDGSGLADLEREIIPQGKLSEIEQLQKKKT